MHKSQKRTILSKETIRMEPVTLPQKTPLELLEPHSDHWRDMAIERDFKNQKPFKI
jgi:hypothetical protein